MLQRIAIVSFMLTCFLWTGTFLHDVDQLDLSFLLGADKPTHVALGHHHHGHSHTHSHGAVSKQIIHSPGSASPEVTAVSAMEMHGHDPSMLGNANRDASDLQNSPAVAPIPYYAMDVVSTVVLIGEATHPRPPPKSFKVPIYLINRAILI